MTQNRLNSFVNLLFPHDIEDSDKHEKIITLTIVACTGAFTFSIMFTSLYFLNKLNSAYIYVDLIGISGCTLLPFVYRLFKRTYIAPATMILVITSFILSFLSYKTGGIYSPSTSWLIIIPVISGFMLGKQGVLIGNITFNISIAILYYLSEFSPAYGIAEETAILKARALFFSSTMISLVIYFAQTNLDDTIKKIEKIYKNSSKLLAVLNKDIEAPLALMEQNVLEMKEELSNCDLKESCDCCLQKPINKITRATMLIRDMITKVFLDQKASFADGSINLEKVDLIKAINNAIFMLSDRLEQKNIKIQYEYKENEVYIVIAEETSLIMQVLSNLISNSIKFSKDGNSIFLNIENSNDSITFAIRDEGIGIPKAIIEKIYSPSHKTSRVGTNGEQGTGFGMPLVKKYIEYYGGHIDIFSKTADMSPNSHGTTFTVTLKSTQNGYNIKGAA